MRNDRQWPALIIALMILLMTLGAALVVGQGGAGRAPQNGSGRSDANKAKSTTVKPRQTVIPYARVAPASNTVKTDLQLRISELCTRNTEGLTLAERKLLEDQKSVSVAPGPGCNDLPLNAGKNCKAWLMVIGAPSDSPCPDPTGQPINENDDLFAQMIFREYLKGRRHWMFSNGTTNVRLDCSAGRCFWLP